MHQSLPPSWSRLLLAALLLALSATASSAQEDDDRTLRWSELDVRAHLDAEGRLHVRERQAMVFDGVWNGGERGFRLGSTRELELESIERIDPATGERIPLVEGDLEQVDHYGWDEGVLRWRSRSESDPPFDDEEIVYELAYTLAPVLARTRDGGYRLAHDFAFAGRAGPIERFQVDLTLDSAWTTPLGNHIREEMAPLPPDRGYVVELAVRYTGDGTPQVGAALAPDWARYAGAAGALLVPLLVLLGLRRRERDLDRIAPATPADEIDEAWLRSHIFEYPAELVGTAWDRSVGEAEVAALLARLVAEGKLSSRVETDDDDEPVLHLRRLVPLHEFAPHERELLEGLFFDGGDETDTASVRKHYEKKGFDPSSKISEALLEKLSALPGEGKIRRRWIPAALLTVAAAVALVLVPDRPGRAPMVAAGLVAGVTAALFALPFASLLSRRITRRRGYTVIVLLAVGAAAAMLALVALGIIPGMDAAVFYRPGPWMLLSLVALLAGIGLWAVALTHPTETAERLAFRRRLASAREYFRDELALPEPRLKDAWFPYLLAFGLGEQVDRWFKAFGASSDRRASDAAVAATLAGASRGGSSGSHGGGWTGGGPQFGGGQFAGGGAGGAWGMAAVGMAAGVAAPASTGGGGGGVAISGGGSGGGW